MVSVKEIAKVQVWPLLASSLAPSLAGVSGIEWEDPMVLERAWGISMARLLVIH